MIARLADETDGADVEICVSDNASRDETASVLSRTLRHSAIDSSPRETTVTSA